MPKHRLSLSRRWLLIQLHRAHIAHRLGSRSRDAGDEIARRMNAIALLCDRGRTEAGLKLAMTLAGDRVLGATLLDDASAADGSSVEDISLDEMRGRRLPTEGTPERDGGATRRPSTVEPS